MGKQVKRTPLYVCFDPVVVSFRAHPLTPRVGKNYTVMRIESTRVPHRSIIFKFPNSLLQKHNVNPERVDDVLREQRISIKFHLNHIEYTDDRALPEDIEIFVVNILPPETAVGKLLIEKYYVGIYHADLADVFWRCVTNKKYYFTRRGYDACVEIKNSRLFLKAKTKLNPPKYTKFRVITKEREFVLTVLEPKSKTEVANMFLEEYPKKVIPLA